MHVLVYAGRFTSQRSIVEIINGNEVIVRFDIPADDTNAFGNPEMHSVLS